VSKAFATIRADAANASTFLTIGFLLTASVVSGL